MRVGKTKIYLNHLKLALGIEDLNKISEKDVKKILEYIDREKINNEVLKELVKIIPDFMSFAQETIKNMNSTIQQIIDAGVSEVKDLKEIILSLNKSLESKHLTDKDKERIFDLINDFSQKLSKAMDRNHELKKLVLKNAFGVILFSSVVIGGLVIYKGFGGRGGDKVFEDFSRKMVTTQVK